MKLKSRIREKNKMVVAKDANALNMPLKNAIVHISPYSNNFSF